MISKQTTLDLNGPILSFTTQPIDVTVCAGVAATFSGIATATFPTQSPTNPAASTGIVTYRWYDQNGALFDNPPNPGETGVTISGAGTTTLTLFNNTQTRRLFVEADYIPSAYQSSSPVTAGTARSTGNAVNDPLKSDTVNLTIFPLISITSEPLDATVAETKEATFSVTATATDASNLLYQWQLNGTNSTDTTTGSTSSVVPVTATITITDNLGGSTIVDFGALSTYSNFISGRTYTLVSNVNIESTLTAAGAGGATSISRSVSGGAGGLSQGTFTFLAGQTYTLVVGAAGGGYTGLFLGSASQANAIIIAGGGGGGANDPAVGGAGGGTTGGNSGNAGPRGGFGGTQSAGGSGGGSSGSALAGGSGSTSGGAAGGGGYFGGGGGNTFNGCCADGGGGGGSGYIHPTLLTGAVTTQGAGSASDVGGTFKMDLVSTQVTVVTTISGSQTPNLRISTNVAGLNQVKCIISHPTACNSPLSTRSANFIVVDPRAIINFENFGEGTPSLTGSGSINLFNNPLLINADSTISARSNCIYAPERDIRVRITMAGSRGNGRNGYRAGYGGVSIFEMTLLQNVEYIFKLGTPTGFGGPEGGANGGGGIAVLYRQGNVLIVCGGGGGAGTSGRGGDGGGIGVGGENGQGRDNGAGGYSIQTGTLDMSGSFAGGTQAGPTFNPIYKTGGKLSKCTIGNYWRNRGVSPCSTMGNVQAFTSTGTAISGSTSSIIRGYKAGIAYRNNGGNGSGNEGGGGAGVVGGNAATGSGAGGGGASGYSSGEVTIVSTQRGGNDGFAYAYIELLS
jgi:hypothetical protein